MGTFEIVNISISGALLAGEASFAANQEVMIVLSLPGGETHPTWAKVVRSHRRDDGVHTGVVFRSSSRTAKRLAKLIERARKQAPEPAADPDPDDLDIARCLEPAG